MSLKLNDFDFPFDETLIATVPVSPAHSSRMLVVQEGIFTHKQTLDFPDFLDENDCLVVNNTKVIKARIFGKIISGGRSASFEATLHKLILQSQDHVLYTAFVRGAKKLRVGDQVGFFEGETQILRADITDKSADTGEVTFKFLSSADDFFVGLDKIGTMPLPPYIASKRKADETDNETYQPIFAKNEGSVAAPTASLHFDDVLLGKIKEKNIQMASVTLHVSGGTFLPVKTDDIHDHVMHSEYAILSEETADMLNAVKKKGGRIICVGTTALRTLETATAPDGTVKAFEGETDIFITPGYKFRAVDILLTNFHLPKSTLFMLVSALAGTDVMKQAYALAGQEKYRFFSYGDSCFLFKKS